MKPYSILWSVVLVICIGLAAACKRPGSDVPKPENRNAASDTQTASAAASQEKKASAAVSPADKKLQAYGTVFNALLDEEGGIPNAYRVITKQLAKARPSDNPEYPVIENLDKTLEILKEGRAASAEGLSEMDAMADELAAAVEKLRAHEKEMLPYFNEKAYREDGMAKAKAAFPALQEDYESALSVLSRFGATLMKQKRANAEKRMEALKSAGEMVRYHTEEIMLLSEELLALFDDPGVPFNRSDAFSRGNAIIVKLDNAVRAQRKAVEDARSEESSRPSPFYDSLRNHAAGIIADYREVRDKRSQTAFDSMLKKYDQAVQDYNSAQTKA